MNKSQLAAYAAVALAFTAMGAYVGVQHKQPAPVTTAIAPTPGGQPHTAVAHLYAQTLPDAAGQQHALAQWRGQPLLVNFWATWCTPCVQEMPELSTLASGSAKVKVIGIGIDSPSNIAAFAAKYQIAYPLYVAGMTGTDLAREMGNAAGGLPFTVLIGADGQVRKTYLGRLKFDQLKADLARL
ncbi:MAG TPA: TlpA disulfide reductase family protein [Telluria sp.]|nr:TlpA disulfide reductase family protein [Telluria sp.]